MRKHMLVCLLLACAVLGLLMWRLVPRSLRQVVGMDTQGVTRASVAVMQMEYESGNPVFQSCQVNTEDLEPEALTELMVLLEGEGYRPDLRNLLPWKVQELSANGHVRSAAIQLFWDAAPPKACHITMLEPRQLGLSESGGFGIYHPLDRQLLDKLLEFAETYGEMGETP